MADTEVTDFVTDEPFINTTVMTTIPVNVYFLGPLGNLVWVPPAIIILIFFVFFSYSFIQFHADNKDRYVARRNQVMVETNTREELTSSFSEQTLNDMFPKRRLRPFALKMDLNQVLKDIWRCHGANPRKLQAMFMQMQMQMLNNRIDTNGGETRPVTSLEMANPGTMAQIMPLGIQARRSSTSNASDSADSLLQERGQTRRIRQLPATPPLTSQRQKPVLQKAASLQSSLGKSSSHGHSVSFHLPHLRSSASSSSSHMPSFHHGHHSHHHHFATQSLLSHMHSGSTNPLISMGILPPSFPGGYTNPLDDDCDNDFISESQQQSSGGQSETKKGKVNVLMMQKFYKKK